MTVLSMWGLYTVGRGTRAKGKRCALVRNLSKKTIGLKPWVIGANSEKGKTKGGDATAGAGG